MIDLNQLKVLGFEVYEPRLQSRNFRLHNGDIWRSSEANVTVFETDNYGIYTNCLTIEKMLRILINATAPRWLGMRVDPVTFSRIPFWIKVLSFSNSQLEGVVNVEMLPEIVSLFKSESNFGIWSFYGLGENFERNERLAVIPDILEDYKRFLFYVGIDLDGILIGYIQEKQGIGVESEWR